MTNLSRYWKAFIAIGGGLLVVLNNLVGQDVFDADVQKWLNVVIAALTALLVYAKANTPTPTQPTGDKGE